MRTILFIAALVCLLISLSAQTYEAPSFALQPFVYQPQTLQDIYPDISIIQEKKGITGLAVKNRDLNIDIAPVPIPVQPVDVDPAPTPEPVEQPVETVTAQPEPEAKPERIPWPEPGYNCCWPQNIDGSLHVDPDSFGGGN